MATLTDTVQILITAEDLASGALRDVGDSISAVADGVGDVTQPLANLATGILAVDAAAAAAAITLVGFAVDAADAFDRAFREIATLIDQPIEGLQSFRQEILAYASDSTQSLEQVTQATYNAVSMGVDYTESLEAVSAAEKLAVAGKAELNATLEGLVGTMNAYGAGMEEASSYSDVFFTTVKLGKTTIPELNDALSRVTGTATLGGVPFADLAAAIATVTSAGAPTSEAVTKINAALSAIIKPSSEASELAKELGIQFDAQALKSKGLEGVLKDVSTATGGSAEKMAKLFGSTEALQAVNVLAITSSEKFATNLDAMANSAGATEAAFGKMAASTGTLQQSLQVALVTFGTPLLDAFSGVEDALAALLGAFSEAANSGEFSEVQGAINALLKGIEDALTTAARNLPAALEKIDWSGFIDSLDVLGDSVGGIFEGVDLSTPEGLAEAIQAIVDTGESLVRITAGIVDGLKPFIRGLADVVSQVNDSEGATKDLVGEILGFATGINSVLPAISSLGTGLSALGAGLGALSLSSVITNIRDLGGISTETAAKLGSAVGKAGLVGAAGAAGYALGTVLNDGISTVLSKVTGSETSLGSWIYDVTHASEDLGGAAPKAATALRDTGTAAGDAAAGFEKVVTPIDELKTKQHDLITSSDLLGDALLKGVIKTEDMATATGALVKVYDNQGNAIEKTKLATGQLVNVIRDAEGNITGYSQAAGTVTDKLNKTSEATKKAKDETEDYKIKLAEISAEIQKAQLEAYVSIKTTQLETDAERVKATFESLDTTISSTGDLLGSLFSNLTEASNLRDKFAIEDQIDLENKRRQEALDLQKELAKAEIERVKAQTEALNRGDALIRIDGAGLEPELEAFMWQILKNIRVRANAEFSDYLLGMSVA